MKDVQGQELDLFTFNLEATSVFSINADQASFDIFLKDSMDSWFLSFKVKKTDNTYRTLCVRLCFSHMTERYSTSFLGEMSCIINTMQPRMECRTKKIAVAVELHIWLQATHLYDYRIFPLKKGEVRCSWCSFLPCDKPHPLWSSPYGLNMPFRGKKIFQIIFYNDT